MIEIVLSVVFWSFIITCVGVVTFVSMRTFSGSHNTNKRLKLNEKTVKAFFDSSVTTNKGHLFVNLIVSGFFLTLISGNHSGVFDDSKQIEDFKRFSGENMKEALKKVGDSYERHYI